MITAQLFRNVTASFLIFVLLQIIQAVLIMSLLPYVTRIARVSLLCRVDSEFFSKALVCNLILLKT